MSAHASEVVVYLRDVAKRVTGGNCMFADDDASLLGALAERAIDAGLTDGLDGSVLRSIKRRERLYPLPQVHADAAG